MLTIFVDEANELLEMSDNTLHEWAAQQADESGEDEQRQPNPGLEKEGASGAEVKQHESRDGQDVDQCRPACCEGMK